METRAVVRWLRLRSCRRDNKHIESCLLLLRCHLLRSYGMERDNARQVQEALDILTGNMDAVCSAVPCVPGVSKTSVTVGAMSGVYICPAHTAPPGEWGRTHAAHARPHTRAVSASG